jgi:hypothetical protein
VFAGGGCRKLEYATTQPVCVNVRHAGMCWKSPPTSPPVLTVTLPPRITADTRSFRSFAFGSICDRKS